MNLYVLLKMVPDTVEELNVSADGKSLDSEFLRFKLNDPDEHALEQALILKEKHGGKVTVVALDAPEVDDVLFTALAKGADRAVKIPVNQAGLGTVAAAKVLADFFASASGQITPDTLILPGSQAIDDLEGELAPFLAAALNLPYVGVVCGVTPANAQGHRPEGICRRPARASSRWRCPPCWAFSPPKSRPATCPWPKCEP